LWLAYLVRTRSAPSLPHFTHSGSLTCGSGSASGRIRLWFGSGLERGRGLLGEVVGNQSESGLGSHVWEFGEWVVFETRQSLGL
jgi:hypothetical protein